MDTARMIALILALFISPALADDAKNFYEKNIDGIWTVYGVTNPERNTSCFAEAKYPNGSILQLTKDLVEDNMFFVIQDASWNITGKPGAESVVQVNMFDNRGNLVNGSELHFKLVNKNTITSRTLNEKVFVPAFYKTFKIVFVMPGDIINAEVYPKNGNKIVIAMAECVKAAGDAMVPSLSAKKPAGESF